MSLENNFGIVTPVTPVDEEEFTGSNDFYVGAVDLKKITADLKSSRIFNYQFDYTQYQSKSFTETTVLSSSNTPSSFRSYIPIPLLTTDQFQNIIETNFKTQLNKANAYVDSNVFFSAAIDPLTPSVEYKLIFQYCKGQLYQTRSKDLIYGLSQVGRNSGFDAIVLKTQNLNDVLSFLDAAGYSSGKIFENYVANKFNAAMDKAKGTQLAYLYEQAPLATLAIRGNEKVWNDFNQLIQLNSAEDTPTALLKAMVQFQKGNKFFENLCSETTLIKTVYHLLKGDVITYNHKLSKRTYFAHQIAKEFVGETNVTPTKKTFYLSENYSIDSNVLESFDSKEEADAGKLFLRQYKKPTESDLKAPPPPGTTDPPDNKSEQDYSDKGSYYSPLDMVYLKIDDQNPILVPAILVKSLADDEEWKQIKFTAEVMLDVFIIIASVASLAGGNVSALVTIAAVVSTATATVDLGLLTFIDDKDPAKEYYITNFRKIALFIEAPLTLPLIAKDILLHGPKLLSYMASRPGFLYNAGVLSARNFITQSIAVAIINIEAVNLTKGTLRIIDPVINFHNIPNFIKSSSAENLYEAGALIVKGEAIVGNATKDGIGLLYKGELVAFGTETEVKAVFRSMEGLKAERMIAHLNKLYYGIGKLPYGNSFLSRLSLELRKTLPDTLHNGNVAVFAYETAGKIETKAFTTLKNPQEWKALGFDERPHAEEIGVKWLKEKSITKVVAVYSELEPCILQRYNCKKMLHANFPDAVVSYSYDYGEQASRIKAIQDRARDLNRILKK